jgi:hypothetical protein
VSVTFSDLIASTTEAAVYATLRSAASIVGIDIEAMPPNAVLRAVLKSVVPPGILRFANVITEIAKGGFLDFASDGPYLEMNGEQVFGVERIRLTFATCTCQFTNENIDGNRYEFHAGQVRVRNPSTGKVYSAGAFTLEAQGDAQDRDIALVTVTAEQAGTDSNADAETITEMVTVFDGVSVTNIDAAIATDLEKRASYVTRCRLAVAGASPYGPSQIYDHIARGATTSSGVPIGVTKTRLIADTIDGRTTLYVAKDSGVPDGPQMERINELLIAGAVPGGVDFSSGSGPPDPGALPADSVTVPITYTATALSSAGLTDAEVEALVATRLEELFVEVPIGGWGGFLYAEKIRAVIAQVQASPTDPRPIVNVSLSLPSGDVALDPNEIAALGTIVPTVNMI